MTEYPSEPRRKNSEASVSELKMDDSGRLDPSAAVYSFKLTAKRG